MQKCKGASVDAGICVCRHAYTSTQVCHGHGGRWRYKATAARAGTCAGTGPCTGRNAWLCACATQAGTAQYIRCGDRQRWRTEGAQVPIEFLDAPTCKRCLHKYMPDACMAYYCAKFKNKQSKIIPVLNITMISPIGRSTKYLTSALARNARNHFIPAGPTSTQV